MSTLDRIIGVICHTLARLSPFGTVGPYAAAMVFLASVIPAWGQGNLYQGVEVNVVEGSPAVVRFDFAMPDKELLLWPIFSEFTGEPPLIAVSFNGTNLKRIESRLISGIFATLGFEIGELKGTSGVLQVSVSATDSGRDSLFLIQNTQRLVLAVEGQPVVIPGPSIDALTEVSPFSDLTFSLTASTATPSWLIIDATTGELTGTPPIGSSGPITDIVIVVSDGATEQSLDAFSVEVLPDFDNDGLPDECPTCDGLTLTEDTDDDNDGVLDILDAFPKNPTETIDTDNDGIGNNTDVDDDNDGFTDVEELDAGSDPILATDTPAYSGLPLWLIYDAVKR